MRLFKGDGQTIFFFIFLEHSNNEANIYFSRGSVDMIFRRWYYKLYRHFILRAYYRAKMDGGYIDKVYPSWKGIRKSDIGYTEIYEYDGNIKCVYLMVHVDEIYERVGVNLGLSFDGFVGMKAISNCSYKEFNELYGDYVMNKFINVEEW